MNNPENHQDSNHDSQETRPVTTPVVFPDGMKTVTNKEFGGERALFATHRLRLESVTFHPGESALKCCSAIDAEGCVFEGKYPFWHVDTFRCVDCHFLPGARAALWYSRNLEMSRCQVDAPKMFREMENLSLEHVRIPDAHGSDPLGLAAGSGSATWRSARPTTSSSTALTST